MSGVERVVAHPGHGKYASTPDQIRARITTITGNVTEAVVGVGELWVEFDGPRIVLGGAVIVLLV
jgi:hypothetical protein